MSFQFNHRSRKKSDRRRSQASQQLESPFDKPDRHRLRRRSPLGLFVLLLLWSIILGLGLAQAAAPPSLLSSSPSSPSSSPSSSLSSLSSLPPLSNPFGNRSNPAATIAQTITPAPEGLVDPVPEELQLGQELYLENCATCHVALPPAVMPTESWREILTQPEHYGAQITPPVQPGLQIIWNYVSVYSRPLKQDEPVPFRLRSSRYFKALHPAVEFADRVNVRSCASCHPGAEQFNYRSLTPEWETAPAPIMGR